MKHLISYNGINLYDEDNIIDIIQELIDTNRVRFGLYSKYLTIRTSEADIPLYWYEITDHVLRLIHFVQKTAWLLRVICMEF